jgi:hypothetical protein
MIEKLPVITYKGLALLIFLRKGNIASVSM